MATGARPAPEQKTEKTKRDWVALEKRYYQGTFKRELVMERGEGTRVWDADGNVYLDLVAGIATNVLGHSHPAVVRAIIDQAQRLIRDGAYEIISMDRSFHGRTLATTDLTGQKKYQDTWQPLPDGFKQVPFDDFEALKAAVSDKTAAILIEAVQGEGGIYPASDEYMRSVRAWC